ncbi:MAG: zf-HC2 domain-containing protein [Candidatus Aminicenantales bacterium]
MNCEEAKDMMTVGVFGTLAREEKTFLDEHLRSCPYCARLFEKAKASWASFEVPDDCPHPDWEKSWDVIAARVLGRSKAWRLFGVPGRWAVAAASLLAVFALGYVAGRRFLKPPTGPAAFPLASAAEPSPLLGYAESLEPVLIDFLNRGESERPQEFADLEQKIIQSMLAETRLLQALAASSRNTELGAFLEEMETILLSLANLKPGDRDSADELGRTIRERRIRSKLRDFSSADLTL